ncbi:type II secretion system F family protein [Pseudomonas entomophila]|jgi:type IV pilus assembly protein PilC|uniref:type II secretion system F family protein n=1 Tax=Pseudomonas entomophila TaxID=312306 RepID=UPI0015E3C93E|nr:type II secretion system F family protein [Pseudomonas entomophila]MBA1193889.1 type II secretion system F family protein [Pseudomonas entomophila]
MDERNRVFVWQGVDAAGVVIKGRRSGRSAALVRALLIRDGIRVTRLRAAPPTWLHWSVGHGRMDPAGFSRQLATMLNAGIPLLQAFDVMSRTNTDDARAALLASLKREVASGLGLAEAMQRHPAWFDVLYCNLVRVGEQSGTLDRQLEQLANMLEQRQAMIKRLRKAMLYPSLLLLVGLGVSALLLLEVVPRFQGLFAGLGGELPPFTRWVIAVSEGLAGALGWLLAALASAAVGARMVWRRRPGVRLWTIRVVLRVPVFGALLSQAALARFARGLATTYTAGVPLLDALGTVARACGDPLHEQAILGVRQAMGNGQSLQGAMASDPLFSPLLVQMVAIGESSGRLDDMLERAAQHYEDQARQTMEQLTGLLEPVIVLILGVLVGGLVIAMYLPIFQLSALM